MSTLMNNFFKLQFVWIDLKELQHQEILLQPYYLYPKYRILKEFDGLTLESSMIFSSFGSILGLADPFVRGEGGKSSCSCLAIVLLVDGGGVLASGILPLRTGERKPELDIVTDFISYSECLASSGNKLKIK